MQLLNGTEVSTSIKAELKANVEKWALQNIAPPHLAAVLIGNNPASEAYVGNKVRTCKEIGFESTLLRFDPEVSEKKLLDELNKLNLRADIDGILVQLPLPPHISETVVINSIHPEKDVDGFHPISQGKMILNEPGFIPATPYGILLMLRYYHIPTAGRHVVVIGRSHIVGTPISILLSRNATPGNATVTLCHSHTTDLRSFTRQADILIVAIGKPQFLKEDMVKKGAVVVDVGINKIEDPTKKSGFRLVGDVDFEAVAPKCSYITPVPKGVGPMTICGLMKNTFLAASRRRKL